MKKMLLIIGVLILQGCIRAPVYYKQYSEQNKSNEQVATLEGSSVIGTLGFGYVSSYVIRVNNEFCKPDYPRCEGIELLPGKYKIKMGIENISFYMDVTFDFVAEPGQKYTVISEEIKPDFNAPLNASAVWLINATSNQKIMKIDGWSESRLKGL